MNGTKHAKSTEETSYSILEMEGNKFISLNIGNDFSLILSEDSCDVCSYLEQLNLQIVMAIDHYHEIEQRDEDEDVSN